jgi:hypothetical protein
MSDIQLLLLAYVATIDVLIASPVETIIGSCFAYRKTLATCHNYVSPVQFNPSPSRENFEIPAADVIQILSASSGS